MTYQRAFEDFERRYLLTILRECEFHQGRAAQMAGVHRNTITRLVARYGIVKPQYIRHRPVSTKASIEHELDRDRARLIAELTCEREGLKKTPERIQRIVDSEQRVNLLMRLAGMKRGRVA